MDFLVDLQEKVSEHIPESELPIYTRHKRGDQIFHGHPNYNNKGHWRDWVIVDWGNKELLAHIHCFVELSNMPMGGKRHWIEHGDIYILEDGVYAVVESANYEDKDGMMFELFVPLMKEIIALAPEDGSVAKRKFYLVDTNAFL